MVELLNTFIFLVGGTVTTTAVITFLRLAWVNHTIVGKIKNELMGQKSIDMIFPIEVDDETGQKHQTFNHKQLNSNREMDLFAMLRSNLPIRIRNSTRNSYEKNKNVNDRLFSILQKGNFESFHNALLLMCPEKDDMLEWYWLFGLYKTCVLKEEMGKQEKKMFKEQLEKRFSEVVKEYKGQGLYGDNQNQIRAGVFASACYLSKPKHVPFLVHAIKSKTVGFYRSSIAEAYLFSRTTFVLRSINSEFEFSHQL